MKRDEVEESDLTKECGKSTSLPNSENNVVSSTLGTKPTTGIDSIVDKNSMLSDSVNEGQGQGNKRL